MSHQIYPIPKAERRARKKVVKVEKTPMLAAPHYEEEDRHHHDKIEPEGRETRPESCIDHAIPFIVETPNANWPSKAVKPNPLPATVSPKKGEAENGREFEQLPDQKEKWQAWTPFGGAELCVNGCVIPVAPV